MSLALAQLAIDEFNRANVLPLASPWAIDEAGDPGLKIVGDLCESATENSSYNVQIYDYTPGTPNDQYASATLGAAPSGNGRLMLAVRLSDTGQAWGNDATPSYVLQVVFSARVDNSQSATWQIFEWGSGSELTSGTGLTINSGDTFAIAAVGSQIFAIQNGVVLGSITDTTNTSGKTALSIVRASAYTDVQLEEFTMGSAALTPTSGGAVIQSSSSVFLGRDGEIGLMEITLPNSVVKGNLILVVITDVEGEETSIPLGPVYDGSQQIGTGIFDTQGNSYSLAVETNVTVTGDNGAVGIDGSNAAAIFYGLASASGSLTVKYGYLPFNASTMTVYEVSGVYSLLDQTGVFVNTNAEDETPQTYSVTTDGPIAYADEFVLAVFVGDDSGLFPGVAWTAMDGVEATQICPEGGGRGWATAFSEAFEYSGSLVPLTATATGAQTLNVTVQPALIATFYQVPFEITTNSLPNATINKAYSQALGASGGFGAYTWSISSGSLPIGMSLDTSTGVISGTPLFLGTSTFTIEVADSSGTPRTATQNLSIAVTDFDPTVPFLGSVTVVAGPSPLTLTELASDNFVRANVSPLTSPWAIDEAGDPGLQIVSDLCESATENSSYDVQLYDYAPGTPDDQYASATVANAASSNGRLMLAVRLTDTGQAWPNDATPSYVLQVIFTAGTWQIFEWGSRNLIASGTYHDGSTPGDTYAIAAVGSTIYALKNGVVLGTVTDTTNTSGITALSIVRAAAYTDVQISLFAMGSATAMAVNPVVGSFLGTVRVITDVPEGTPVNYLGHVVVGTPSGSPSDPAFGQVVVIDTAPSGVPDPFIGTVEE
ncbi:MAG: Ig domain-containing protein [Candidatus Acidiferrales bacterium]